ncbi:hypothetical protein [Ruminococcus sp. NK3A76]|nr:hypothetical protein [Ruminococcus sp. NK3A76]
MMVDIDDLISWLLAQGEKELDFSAEQQQRIYERIFLKKEADELGQE